jgi:hypothetical protein
MWTSWPRNGRSRCSGVHLAAAHQLGSSVWASYAAARLAMAHSLERDFAKAGAVLDGEMDVDTPFESATQRQLWCARAELLLACGSASEALGIADKLAATLAPGKVAPRVWILRGEALTELRSAAEAEHVFAEAIETSRAFDLRSLLWRAHTGLHVFSARAVGVMRQLVRYRLRVQRCRSWPPRSQTTLSERHTWNVPSSTSLLESWRQNVA